MATSLIPAKTQELPSPETVPAEPVRDVTDTIVPIEDIRAEAYTLFLGRGGEHGHDVEDWLAAEALVRARQVKAAPRES